MRVAFIGLGAMGLPMALNLSTVARVDLVAFDLSDQRMDLLGDRGRRASSVADAVEGADAVFTVLPTDPHVLDVVRQVADAHAGNRWFVDFSTIGPSTIDEVSRLLSPGGTETISVTLTRSTAAAQSGELGLFVGGVNRLPATLEPLFAAMASDTFFVGSRAASKTFKIVNNMIVAVLDIAICEAIVLGGLAGLAPDTVTSALHETGRGSASWVLANHIEKYVLPDDLGPGRFSTRYMAKDVALCSAFAEEQSLPAFFAGLALSCYRGSVAHGYGDDYHMKVIRWLEGGAAAGRTVPVDEKETLAALVSGMAGVQLMVSHEAIRLAGGAGMAPVEAAQAFTDGSGGNDGLGWILQPPAERGPSPTVDEVLASLAQGLTLARALDAPAMTFEIAKHGALSLASGDRSRAVWEGP